MSRMILIVATLLVAMPAFGASTYKRVELENQIRNRVEMITDKVDPLAIVQVNVNLKKMNSTVPIFGFDVEVTPLESDGELGASSIENVTIRVITQVDSLPEWLRKEIDKAVGLDGVKINVAYEKAAGTIANQREEFARIAREAAVAAVKGLDSVKFGVWGIFAGLLVTLSVIAIGIFGVAKRLERSLTKVIKEEIVPAMQANKGGSAPQVQAARDSSSDKPMTVQMTGGGGGAGGAKEMADLPPDALVTLLNDCYWTQSDGYAHYIWSQMTQEQREHVLGAKQLDTAYFSYVRQTPPVNLGYHMDARYLMSGKDFLSVSQDDLLEWVNKNPKQFHRVTPLRWDLLPLSLESRITFNSMPMPALQDTDPVKVGVKSKPRVLVSQLQIKTLKASDEEFIWNNPDKVPEQVRGSLRSLVWLALSPVDYRTKILGELDARQLAEAWTGPEPVLAKLTEVLPEKKREMLKHFLATTSPSRESDAFAYLFQSGLQSPKEPSEHKEAA